MWLKLDDGFAEHPKIEALSGEALRAHLKGLCYSARYLTDGVIPRGAGLRMADPAALAELLRSGMWVETPGGFEIHDFLDFNPSKEEYEALQAKKSAAGKRSAETRWHKTEDEQVTPVVTPVITGVVTPAVTPVQPSRPVPSRPSPVPDALASDARARGGEPPGEPPPEAPPPTDPPSSPASDVALATQVRDLTRRMVSTWEAVTGTPWRFSRTLDRGYFELLRAGPTVDELAAGWKWMIETWKDRSQVTPGAYLRFGWDRYVAANSPSAKAEGPAAHAPKRSPKDEAARQRRLAARIADPVGRERAMALADEIEGEATA